MTRFIPLTTAAEYKQFCGGDKTFKITTEDEKYPIRIGDTIYLQFEQDEVIATCTAVHSEPETPGLRKGYVALALKIKEA